MMRGCFSPMEDGTALKNGVPLFDSADAAMKFCADIVKQNGGSNPGFPTLKHSVTTFIGKKQIEDYLVPRIIGKDVKLCSPFDFESIEEDVKRKNLFINEPLICQQITTRLDKNHSRLSCVATLNTLKYTFEHMRCGILVQIRAQQVVTFAPFVNDKYKNEWGPLIKTEFTTLAEYYKEKEPHYGRKENILPDTKDWWANGNIICNEAEDQYWGDNLLLPLKHMLETVCKERKIPDADFFLNKRDFPQLRMNLTEPYDFAFDERNRPLPKAVTFENYAPIVSFYCSPNFADLPIPTTEDWKGVIGQVFPESTIDTKHAPTDLYLKVNFDKFSQIPWEKKKPIAFFRGSATGGGTTAEDNQRLKLASLGCVAENKTVLDAGVTGYNVRDKKLFGQPMRFSMQSKLPPKASRVPMYKQSEYKYLIYVDGHCAANRYAFLLKLGVTILRVGSICEASQLWFFPLLKGITDEEMKQAGGENQLSLAELSADHILIKPDLSDLLEKIQWCIANDDVCKKLAENARKFYLRYLDRNGVLDYWQMLLLEMGKRQVALPDWFQCERDDLFEQEYSSIPRINHGRPCLDGVNSCKTCEEEAAMELEQRRKRLKVTAEDIPTNASSGSSSGVKRMKVLSAPKG